MRSWPSSTFSTQTQRHPDLHGDESRRDRAALRQGWPSPSATFSGTPPTPRTWQRRLGEGDGPADQQQRRRSATPSTRGRRGGGHHRTPTLTSATCPHGDDGVQPFWPDNSAPHQPPPRWRTRHRQTARAVTVSSDRSPANTLTRQRTTRRHAFDLTRRPLQGRHRSPLWHLHRPHVLGDTPTAIGDAAWQRRCHLHHGMNGVPAVDQRLHRRHHRCDTTPPTLTSATVPAPGGRLGHFQFSETRAAVPTLPPASAFTVTADGSDRYGPDQRPARAGVPDGIRITISPDILQGQAVVVTYTDPTSGDDALPSRTPPATTPPPSPPA